MVGAWLDASKEAPAGGAPDDVGLPFMKLSVQLVVGMDLIVRGTIRAHGDCGGVCLSRAMLLCS